MATDPRFCYVNEVVNPNIIWQSGDILKSYFPMFVIQLICFVFSSRFIYYVLRPFNVPRHAADMIPGILLSKGILSRVGLDELLVPPKGIVFVNTIAYLGLIYHVFLAGLEMNLEHVLRARKKATSIAVASTLMPMMLGPFMYYILQSFTPIEHQNHSKVKACMFWSYVLSITSFPVLANVLADLKILYTGLGKLALSTATIIDIYNWILFVFLIPFTSNGKKGIYSVISTTIYVLFCYIVVKPLLARFLDEKTNKNEWDNYQLSFVAIGVLVSATITDLLGTHSVLGALVFGVIIPRGKLVEMLIERLDDISSGYLGPLFYACLGIRFDMSHTHTIEGWSVVLLIMFISWTFKIVSTVIATRLFPSIAVKEGAALGVLLNTKGILSMIVLYTAWDKRHMNREDFSILVLSNLSMTMVAPCIINLLYKPRQRVQKNKLRTVQNLKGDMELKVLVGVHNTRQANGMLNILEAFSGFHVSPLRVTALKLVELKGRAAGLLSAHMDEENNDNVSKSSAAQEDMNNNNNKNNVAKTFETYAEEHEGNRVENIVAVSSYTTIHEDIYNLALDKQSSLVLLPFHKQSSGEGSLEVTNPAFATINQHVLKNAPCSVGIFVDRGVGSLLKSNLRIVMLFIGGSDDREALSIARRMSRHPKIQLCVVRLRLMGDAAQVDVSALNNNNESKGLLSEVLDNDRQKELDEECVGLIRLLAVNSEDSISYEEKQVHNGDDIPDVLNELDQKDYDLYIVGQGNDTQYVVLTELLKWTDSPELGVIGDIVASNSFGSTSSVLVVQQYGQQGMDYQSFFSTQFTSMKLLTRFW